MGAIVIRADAIGPDARPGMKTDFIHDLRSLTTQLNREADTWGESREGPHRLGFLQTLQVLVRMDEEDMVAEVVDVALR